MDANSSMHFLNLEYWFRLLYELVVRSTLPAESAAFAANLWQIIIGVASVLSVLFLAGMVYFTIRIYQIRKDEEPRYETEEPEKAEHDAEHSRFAHIRSLIEGTSESDWRQAIIEADIMLDEILRTHGYQGDGVGERLKQVDRVGFPSLNEAWEAHKVRNQIAHEGAAFRISEQIARRTVARYETVFREFGEI